jgi:hypothetical protein
MTTHYSLYSLESREAVRGRSITGTVHCPVVCLHSAGVPTRLGSAGRGAT